MRNAMAGEDGAARTQDGKRTGELDGLRLAQGEPTRMGMYRDIMQMLQIYKVLQGYHANLSGFVGIYRDTMGIYRDLQGSNTIW